MDLDVLFLGVDRRKFYPGRLLLQVFSVFVEATTLRSKLYKASPSPSHLTRRAIGEPLVFHYVQSICTAFL